MVTAALSSTSSISLSLTDLQCRMHWNYLGVSISVASKFSSGHVDVRKREMLNIAMMILYIGLQKNYAFFSQKILAVYKQHQLNLKSSQDCHVLSALIKSGSSLTFPFHTHTHLVSILPLPIQLGVLFATAQNRCESLSFQCTILIFTVATKHLCVSFSFYFLLTSFNPK